MKPPLDLGLLQVFVGLCHACRKKTLAAQSLGGLGSSITCTHAASLAHVCKCKRGGRHRRLPRVVLWVARQRKRSTSSSIPRGICVDLFNATDHNILVGVFLKPQIILTSMSTDHESGTHTGYSGHRGSMKSFKKSRTKNTSEEMLLAL